jgi:hypothetical protein
MPFYYAFFVDHDGNIYRTHHFEGDSDKGAIEAALQIKPPSISAGTEVWQDDRLVYRQAPRAVFEKPKIAVDTLA